jgi:phosphatidylserine synthase
MSRKAKKVEPPSKRRNKSNLWKITLGRGFFILNAILWFAYGVYIYYDMAVRNKNTSSADLLTLFVFINAGFLLFSGIKFGKPEKWTYFFALAVVAFNAILSLLNILDLFFLLSFLIDLLTLWTVISLYRQYFPKP